MSNYKKGVWQRLKEVVRQGIKLGVFDQSSLEEVIKMKKNDDEYQKWEKEFSKTGLPKPLPVEEILKMAWRKKFKTDLPKSITFKTVVAKAKANIEARKGVVR